MKASAIGMLLNAVQKIVPDHSFDFTFPQIICSVCFIKKTGYEIGLQKYVDEKLNTFVAICQQEALEHSSCLKVIWSKLEVWV